MKTRKFVFYEDVPCVCGHVFGSHGKVFGNCRLKSCRCRRFLNREYVDWLAAILKADAVLLRMYRKQLSLRLKAKKS